MTVSVLCARCSLVDITWLPGSPDPDPVRHCFGQDDTAGIPGLIGSGTSCCCSCRTWPHSPSELWDLACAAHPNNMVDAVAEYDRLMVAHGHRTAPSIQSQVG